MNKRKIGLTPWLCQLVINFPLGHLDKVEGSYGMLTNGLLISVTHVWISLTNDFSHLQLSQLLWQGVFLVKHAALQGCLVLDELSNDFIEVLPTYTDCLGALRHSHAIDLDVTLARLLIDTKIGLALPVATWSVVKAFLRPGILGSEFKPGRQYLLH